MLFRSVPHALKLKTALDKSGKAPVELGLHWLYCKSMCITSLTKCERQNASNALDVQMVRRSIGSSFGVEVFEVPGCEVGYANPSNEVMVMARVDREGPMSPKSDYDMIASMAGVCVGA